jgi:predicted transcriptional regulator
MTNYFKVYLKPVNKSWKRADVKTSKEVKDILQEAQRRGYERYLVIKRIKQKTDIPVAHGVFSKECKVVEVDGLDTDWRIVGANVVDWDKFKKAKEGEER